MAGEKLGGKANLQNARLYNTNFRGTRLVGADLRNANLTNADFCGADLSMTNLEGSVLTDAKFDISTILPDEQKWVPGTNLTKFGAIVE